MHRTALAVVALLVLGAAPALADAPACPAAVSAGVLKAFPRAAIASCKAERDHDKDFFEVVLTRTGGARIEVDVAPDGAILQIEETVAVDALPDRVKKAFAAKYPRARPTAVSKQTAGKDVRYEIAFQTDKGRKEATFAADGKFVEEE
jgi:hypothetical protein